jgi:hypothetical protein
MHGVRSWPMIASDEVSASVSFGENSHSNSMTQRQELTVDSTDRRNTLFFNLKGGV